MRQQGKIKWLNDTKGYGFVVPTGGGPDAFLHITMCEACGYENPQQGDQVEFEAVQSQTGMKVVRVGRVSHENAK